MEKDFKITYSIYDGEISLVNAVNTTAQLSYEDEVHIHYDCSEIYYFLDGDLYFSFEGRHIPIKNGSMIIIDSGCLHRPIVKSNKRYERKRILINKKFFHRFETADYSLYTALHNEKIFILNPQQVNDNHLDSLFNQAEKSIKNNTPFDSFCATISIASLFTKVISLLKSPHYKKTEQIQSKTTQIIEYINKNLKEDLSYSALAKKFFISEKYLYKLFKKEVGFTLSNYIKERRFVMAISLLNSGYNAFEAAEKSGFNDYSVFYRTFRKKTGMTPTQYREKNK